MVQLLASKDELAAVIKHFKARVEAESGKRLHMLRTYRGGEFTSVEFGQYCADHDIGATPLRAILAIAERHGGTAEPDGRRHVKEHDEGQEDASRVLGQKLKSGSPWAMSELQLKRSLVQESSKKNAV